MNQFHSICPVRKFRVLGLDHARVCRLAVGRHAFGKTCHTPLSVVGQSPERRPISRSRRVTIGGGSTGRSPNSPFDKDGIRRS